MAPSLENQRVETFYFRLMRSDYNEEEGASYFPHGVFSPAFRGTLTQAKDAVKRFHYQEDKYACGACIYAQRNGAWQEIESYLGSPE